MAESRFAKLAARKAAEIEAEAASEPLFLAVEDENTQKSNMTGNMTVQQSNPKVARKESNKSVKESIRDTIKSAGTQAVIVLKTVTIKLSPELDKRVEDHCYSTGRLKQDVVRDGLLLYFEAIEEDE